MSGGVGGWLIQKGGVQASGERWAWRQTVNFLTFSFHSPIFRACLYQGGATMHSSTLHTRTLPAHTRARARTNAHTNTASGGTGGAPLAPVSLLAEGKMCSKTYVYINFVVF